MGRRPIGQGIEEEAKARLGLRLVQPQNFQDGSLHGEVVDTNAAAPKLVAVQHQIVGPGQRGAGIGFQAIGGALRGRKGMVQGRIGAAAILFEHGEGHHPKGGPGRVVHQIQILA